MSVLASVELLHDLYFNCFDIPCSQAYNSVTKEFEDVPNDARKTSVKGKVKWEIFG